MAGRNVEVLRSNSEPTGAACRVVRVRERREWSGGTRTGQKMRVENIVRYRRKRSNERDSAGSVIFLGLSCKKKKKQRCVKSVARR